MKTGKTLKIAGSITASLALLAMLAGCGQASSPKASSKNEVSSSSTPAKNASQGPASLQASAPAASPSSPTATSSSSSSASASAGSSAPTSQSASSTSIPASTAPSTTQPMPSDEVLYLLAYIKYRGGIEDITPEDLIVDEYMIGTQKGTVMPTTPPTQVPLQMVVNGEEVKVIGPPSAPESTSTYSLKAVYNIDSLVSEYYSTPTQQAEVNSLLQEGERHNLLDVLALLKSQSANASTMEGIIVDSYLNGGNNPVIGADTTALIVIDGEQITFCINSASGANYPVTHQYYHFTSQSLINEYYSTSTQKAQIDEYMGLGIGGYRY